MGSIRRIRSARGGCVARPLKRWPTASPKKRWLASAAAGALTFEPSDRAPIFLRAPAMPSGLRVNWTAEASARYSRWRLTAALIRLPKKTPT